MSGGARGKAVVASAGTRPDVYYPVLDQDVDLLAAIKWQERDRNVKRKPYRLVSSWDPAGDQPAAIEELVKGVNTGQRDQVLLGVTGSGKTFTMAHIIAQTGRPAVIMAPNKTLAAQLYSEMKRLFPQNAVEYFVSYYDYFQPEAYVPSRDLYIEKTSDVNEMIDRMRHSATRSILERGDVILVASVSCIYGIGSPEDYSKMILALKIGQKISPPDVTRRLSDLQYTHNRIDFARGTFRSNGDVLDIFPSHLEDRAVKVSFFGNEIDAIALFDPLTGAIDEKLEDFRLYGNSHYVITRPTMLQAVERIERELVERLDELRAKGFLLEAQRLEQRTRFDIESMVTTGICPGIENYSRHLTGRAMGLPPPTLFEYLPSDAILFVDESHVAVPQIGAMFKGDYNRKKTLAEYGFRLPSCVDNRPLRFDEWERLRPQTIFVSATPGDWELERTQGVFTQQVVRPTGLLDPVCLIRPVDGQVDDLLFECRACAARGLRVLVTTLTKRMAEELNDYFGEQGIRSRYLHSDIETLERIEIIQALRRGEFDILVGINLLREGLDIPECGLVAILDADKEGFLRSHRSLIQMIGRAARNVDGRVILYADSMTASLKSAMNETDRRRQLQREYNEEHGITPYSVSKDLSNGAFEVARADYSSDWSLKERAKELSQESLVEGKTVAAYIDLLRGKMKESAKEMEFEIAARCRDEIKRLDGVDLEEPATDHVNDPELIVMLENVRAKDRYLAKAGRQKREDGKKRRRSRG